MTPYRYPNITGTTDAQQLHQLKNYLYQLVEQLNNSAPAAQPVTQVVTQGNPTAPDFAELKGLIIKSADIVSAYTDKIGKNLSGTYVAQSDYGTFLRQTQAALAANATAIDQCYSHIEQVTTALEQQQRQTSAYIRTGLLSYAQAGEILPEGTPVYGVEVGQSSEDSFRCFGRFTAYGMTFYDENGDPAAQISQGQLRIPHAQVELTFTEGGFTDEILPDGSVITRWTGK